MKTVGGVGPLSPPPRDVATRHRVPNSRWIVAIAIAVSVLLAGTVIALYLSVESLKRSLGDGVAGATTSYAAYAADSAGSFAGSRGMPYGSLTPSLLNVQQPEVRWVGGSDAVPASGVKKVTVGFSAAGTHIVTAAEVVTGTCTYGLVVSSASDPLVNEDHLPRPGIYGALATGPGVECAADRAPTTGWFPVGRSTLRMLRTASSSGSASGGRGAPMAVTAPLW
jgi:hypothetical protein